MELLNGRYKIQEVMNEGFHNELYIVNDLWENQKKKYLKIYIPRKDKKVIAYFVDNFINLNQVRHENLLHCEWFNVVETINLKKNDVPIYCVISEYTEAILLDKAIHSLDFKSRIMILLDSMKLINYLHFKGVSYKVFNPFNIYLDSNNRVKLRNLSSAANIYLQNIYEHIYEDFMDPKITINPDIEDTSVDLYSLGNLIKYLFFNQHKDILANTKENFKVFKDELDKDTKMFLTEMAYNLIENNENLINDDLILFMDRIIKKFQLEYNMDYKLVRNKLSYITKIRGREKELNKIINIDVLVDSGLNEKKLILINGKNGVGKSRFLREIGFRLRFRGKKVCNIKIDSNDNSSSTSINKLFKETVKFASNEILNKYKHDFSFLIPNSSDENKREKTNTNEVNSELRLYNRINSYLSELSKEDKIYIIIDDIEKANEKCLDLIDYLISNLENKSIIFILALTDGNKRKRDFVRNKIKSFSNMATTYNLELKSVIKEDYRRIISDILGTEDISEYIFDYFYSRSDGNLKQGIDLLKTHYNQCGIYIDESGKWYLSPEKYDKNRNQRICNNNIRSQIDKIDKKTLKIFQIISIFNNIYQEDIIAKILDLDLEELEGSIQVLLHDDIIEQSDNQTTGLYTINNIELKDLVYLEIDMEERKELHKKASTILYELYLKKGSLYLEELLIHLFKSDQFELATEIIFTYLKEQKIKYSGESIYLLELAERFVKTKNNSEIFQILDALIQRYFLKGDTNKVGYYLDKLHYISMEKYNVQYLVKVKYFKCELFLNDGRLEDVKNIIGELEELLSENDFIENTLRLLEIKIRYNLYLGKLTLVEKDLNKAFDLCKNLGNKLYLGIFYNLKGSYEQLLGNYVLALNDFQESMEYLNKIKNPIQLLKAINNIAYIYYNNLGDYNQALDYYNKAYDIADRYGLMKQVSAFLNNIGEIYLSKFQYSDSVDYFKKCISISNDIQATREVFISSANLGIAYLQIGEINKTFKILSKLKDSISENPNFQKEILGVYYKFQGYLYIKFGDWEESIRSFQSMGDIFKGHNQREYLNSKFMVCHCKYFLYNDLDIEEMRSLVSEYDDTGLIYDRHKTLLVFSALANFKEDNEFSKELFLKYKNEKYDLNAPILDVLNKLIIMNLDPNKENLEQMENIIYCDNKDLNNIKVQIHSILGFKWFKLKEYRNALRNFLKSLDLIFKFIDFNGYVNLKFDYIRSQNGDLIKEYLYNTIELEFGRKIGYARLSDIQVHELDNYFGFNRIFESLSNEEFMSLININDSEGYIKSLDELLYKMGEDYKSNLKSILLYLKKETLADRGFIIIQDVKNGEFIDVISMVAGDDYSKKNGILNLSNRSSMGVLLNKTFPNMNDSKYIEYLSNEIVALMCVPVSMPSQNKDFSNRRKNENDLNYQYKAYIYLETNSMLSRFDFNRLKLINSLSYLVYINIENSRLKIASTIDKLTGVLTRKQFEFDLDDLILKYNRLNSTFSLLMLDIDDFKDINDTYGHLKGDETLAVIGKTLNSSVRNVDLVGRYGGEEFIIALINTNIEEGQKVAEKIRAIIEQIEIPGINRKITVSIGLSQYPNHSQFKKVLINKADQALYESKTKKNKNNVTLWNNKIGKKKNKSNNLEGLVFGNTSLEYKNMNSILEVISLNTRKLSLENKINIFLGIINSCLGSLDSTLFILDEEFNYKNTFYKSNKVLGDKIKNAYNQNIIERVLKSRLGEFMIDWENSQSVDEISGMPNWQSIMVLPLITRESIKGILYLTVPLKEKEFDNASLNISKLLSDAFSPNLEESKGGRI